MRNRTSAVLRPFVTTDSRRTALRRSKGGIQRRRAGSNRRMEVLQTSALPLGYGAGARKVAPRHRFLKRRPGYFRKSAGIWSRKNWFPSGSSKLATRPPHFSFRGGRWNLTFFFFSRW